MSDPTETLKKAIDEAIEPLVTDHRVYLANGDEAAMPVTRADLHYIFDQYHGQMLDFSADMMPIGHSHPFVHNAVREHMDYYMRTAPIGEHVVRWPVEYAHDLVATLTPEESDPVHQVLFTEGEREAVLVAIDMARQLSDGWQIATVDTDVHNWVSSYSHDTMSVLPVDEFWLRDFKWEDKCCILMSLVCNDGRVLEPKWVQEVANTALAHQVPVIIDESRTGFGRFGGNMWGHQRHNVDPDILVLGGPVGGGMALGAVVTAAVQFDRVSWDLSPQAGSPVACAAGAATLKAVNPGVLSHVMESSVAFDAALHTLVDQFPEYVVATYGLGLHRVVEFQSIVEAQRFSIQCRSHGLLVAPPVGSSLVLTPPLIASEMELKRGVDLMADTLLDWYEKDSPYS